MVAKRYAFTMIELIFAIVIIGITVVSLPMMIQVNAKSTDESSLQEALFFASTNLNMMMSHVWDEHSLDPNEPNQDNEKAVVVNTGNSKYAPVTNEHNLTSHRNGDFRRGHITRRFLKDNANNYYVVSNLGSTDEVSEINGTDEVERLNPISAIGDKGAHAYKREYGGTPSVSYISDASSTPFEFSTTASANPTNIRMLEAIVTDPGDSNRELVILRAYVANIGQAKPYHREYR